MLGRPWYLASQEDARYYSGAIKDQDVLVAILKKHTRPLDVFHTGGKMDLW